MKYAIQGTKGFQATETLRLKSKDDKLTLTGEVKAVWTDAALSKIPEDTVMRFLTNLGQNLVKDYKSKLSSWEKDVQKQLDKAAQAIEKLTLAFEKAGKKTPPTAREIENFVTSQNNKQTDVVKKIAADAQISYSKMVESLMKSVLPKTIKSMAEKAQLFKKSKGSLAWAVLKFVGAAVLLTVAALGVAATGGTAVAVGFAVAALVFKGLSMIKSLGGEIVTFCKAYEAAMIKIDRDVIACSASIDTAIANMRAAQKARDGMIFKLGQAHAKLDDAQKKAASDNSHKDLKKAMANLKKVQTAIQSFEKSIGGNPDAIMASLVAARKALKDTSSHMPVAVKSGKSTSTISKLFDKANEIVGQINGWVN